MTAGYMAAVIGWTVAFCALVLAAAAVCTWVGARYGQAAGRRQYETERLHRLGAAVQREQARTAYTAHIENGEVER